MRVKNGRVIRHLSVQSLWASRRRKLIAVLAIALTSLLFTSLFTIAASVNEGFQQSNFRKVGGISHGGFKYLSEEQFLQLREDPRIEKWGLRRFLGMPKEEPFQKDHVEIGFADKTEAEWMFCEPLVGRLPQEGTDEAAVDLKILELLEMEPELGATFTLTFPVDGRETTQRFTLCGWWETDPVVVAKHILIPESRVNAILEDVGLDPEQSRDGMTGSWNLDVMLPSSLQIEKDMLHILERNGYEEGSRQNGKIPIGVNWGYAGAQLFENMDLNTILAAFAALLLILFTGYLIINNIFRISVAGDIRFYGLLKTIGATPRQLRRMVRIQALTLSLCGIPLGLVLGWLLGAVLSPVLMRQLDGIVESTSANPIIFVGAALFSLGTVLLSCRRPGRMAGKVSPVEALRYTEARASGGRRRDGKLSLFSMAWANLGRSRVKTAITVLSLSLAVVLLNLVVTFTNGFDMDRYLRDVPADFIVADASYFQTSRLYSADAVLPEDFIAELEARGGVKDGGRCYGKAFAAEEFVSEEWFRHNYSHWSDEQTVESLVKRAQRDESGKLLDRVQLSGMEASILDRLTVLEGDLGLVYEPGSRYIAASLSTDDYGKPDWNSHWARVGDEVTIRYVEQYEEYNPLTGEIYGPEVDLNTVDTWARRAKVYRDEVYTVAALVDVPHALGYRYYGADEFILNDETFRGDSGTANVMYYAFDMESPEAVEDMEAYLAVRTEEALQDYESKETYIESFRGFQNLYRILGGTLSFIVGLIGVLNFFNTTMTGIFARHKEFAVLQAVGMTRRQLRRTLIWEGLLYALSAAAAALLLVLALSPLLLPVLERSYWFFSGRLILTPVLASIPIFALLGWGIPSMVYRHMAKQSVVERLRSEEV